MHRPIMPAPITTTSAELRPSRIPAWCASGPADASAIDHPRPRVPQPPCPACAESRPPTPAGRRRRSGRGFVYLDEDGAALDADLAARCRALVIPPAWEEVWICPCANGHIQAVGTDAAGRRQYLYHPAWREQRDAAKHDRVLVVAARLPAARRRAESDLGHDEMTRERALATAFRLLDLGLLPHRRRAVRGGERQLRPGDDPAAPRPRRRRRGQLRVHGQVGPGAPRRGRANPRSSRRWPSCIVVAAADRSCWPTASGGGGRTSRPTTSTSTSRQVIGGEVSAKDFRTWHGTVLAAVALAERAEDAHRRGRRARAPSREAMRSVSQDLGNTMAVARRSYVDPRVVDRFEDGVDDRAARCAGCRPRAGAPSHSVARSSGPCCGSSATGAER